jgi:hypothetical protein
VVGEWWALLLEGGFGGRKEWDISDPTRQVSADKLTVQGLQSLVERGGRSPRSRCLQSSHSEPGGGCGLVEDED